MPAIQIPGTNITYGWQEREKGWGPGMNTNLLVMGQVARGSVISRQQSAPPLNPSEGDAYLVPAGATGEWLGEQDKIAAFHSDAWLYIEPFGSPVLIEDENVHVYWNGGAYEVLGGVGDLKGPTSSTDGEVPRFDGVTGKVLQGSPVRINDPGNMYGHGAVIKEVASTTYTLQESDCGKILHFTHVDGCTVTCPGPTALAYSSNIQCVLVQKSAGPVTVAEDAESTVHSSGDLFSTAQLNAELALYRYSATDYQLGGERA